MDLAQAKAASLTDRLGREEGFEHTLHNVLRHPRSGIADRNLHVLSGDKVLDLPAVLLVEKRIAGRDRQLTAFRHGVAGVDGEIEDGCLQLDWIGFDLPEAVGGNNVESDRLAQRAAEEI